MYMNQDMFEAIACVFLPVLLSFNTFGFGAPGRAGAFQGQEDWSELCSESTERT
jgi:hypothetical protein